MKYDLHMHTHYSKCSNIKPWLLLKMAKKRGLNGVAITDHHEINGALEIKKLNRDKNFEVIVGEEVSTNYGDILVYYLDKKIDAIDFDHVADEAKKQGALISIAHPFRNAVIENHKFKLPISNVKNKIDAVECFNARMLPGNNKKAKDAAEKLNIAKTGGSDSHFLFEIGNAYTIFDGNLRNALKTKTTKVYGTIMLGAFAGALSYLRRLMQF